VSRVRTGTRVTWSYGGHEATGKVVERFAEPVTRTIKGSSITRNGSEDNHALLIEQDDGDRVLKLESEVETA
jgi:Hypervirulence associated proteins TUDOR domain